MDDIRLFGNDGDYLILEALDGQKFRLISDESLKSAIRRDTHSKLDSISLTPREIQDHIRNGMSIEDIVSASGAPFDFVEKFAAPVLDELAHMVDSAKSVRITTSQDRYNDSAHVEFGELVESRLGHSGASEFSWSAKRGEFNSWNVSVHFLLAGEDSFAAWSFDPRKLTLSPENESAVTLSTNDPLTTTPIPKLRPVLQAEQELGATEVIDTPPFELASVSEVEPESVQRKVATTPWVTQLVPVQNPEPDAVPVVEETQAEPDQPLSATADLLQALRIKRGEREAAAESASRENESTEKAVEVVKETQVSFEPEEPVTPVVPKKGRAAMPSWDQIVFGTKTED